MVEKCLLAIMDIAGVAKVLYSKKSNNFEKLSLKTNYVENCYLERDSLN